MPDRCTMNPSCAVLSLTMRDQQPIHLPRSHRLQQREHYDVNTLEFTATEMTPETQDSTKNLKSNNNALGSLVVLVSPFSLLLRWYKSFLCYDLWLKFYCYEQGRNISVVDGNFQLGF